MCRATAAFLVQIGLETRSGEVGRGMWGGALPSWRSSTWRDEMTNPRDGRGYSTVAKVKVPMKVWVVKLFHKSRLLLERHGITSLIGCSAVKPY
jgi:hypothetical protein